MSMDSNNAKDNSSTNATAGPTAGPAPELLSLLDKLVPPAVEAQEPPGEEGWSLPRLVGMVRRKAWIIGVMAIACSAYMGFRDTKQVIEYQSSFRLLVEPVHQTRELQQLTDDKSATTTQELDYSTQIEVLYSPKLLNPIFEQVNERYPGTTFDSTVGRLSVSRLGETKIIEVSFYDTNPEKVKVVLEKLSQGYLDYSLQNQQAQLRQGLAFVDQQLPAIQERVNSLQQQIQELRQEYNFTDPDSYSEQLMTQLGAIAQQRQSIQSDLAALKIQYANLQQTLGATAALSQSANYQATLQQYQVLEQQIAVESARFGTRNPTIALLQRQQTNLFPILQRQAEEAVGEQVAAVANQIQMLMASDQAIALAEKALTNRFHQMPAVSRLYTELQRELTIATESLTRFLETQERLQIQAAQNEVPWELIAEPAPPHRKSSSSFYKTLVMGAIMGFVLGAIIAFLIEKLENTSYTLDELKKTVKLSILGTIPYNPDLEQAEPSLHIVDLRQSPASLQTVGEDSIDLKNRLKQVLQQADEQSQTGLKPIEPNAEPANAQQPNSTDHLAQYWLTQSDAYGFLEAFRALYANLERRKGKRLQSIVISSALPSEGRTTVAVHLVQAAAALGRRVLLVDAHCRRGGTQVHTLLGLPNEVGLTHYLTQKAPLSRVIQRLSWESSLFVISAGDTPNDPTRLLASTEMCELMERLRKTFDLVIYDMPPLMGLADVSLIASQADGILLVASLGKRGSNDALKQTVERLNVAHLPILGVVANCVKDYSVDLYMQG